MVEFIAAPGAAPAPGMVLRLRRDGGPKYLRVTHVFKDCVYAMWISEPENARYARRPAPTTHEDLHALSNEPGATWGRVRLPPALCEPTGDESGRQAALTSAWELVHPLVTAFEREANLSRNRFTSLIRERADAIQARFVSLHRLVLRYYYFGGVRAGLLPLPRGPAPGDGGYAARTPGNVSPPRRRGRQAILARELGRNDFIVTEEDITDMVDTLKTCLRKGPTFLPTAHEEYLADAFRRRHPELHARYVAGEIVEPVTVRQFRYYVDTNTRLSEELARNRRSQQRNPGFLGSVRAAGPAEVYEIDSTGGRMYLVAADNPQVIVGKPTIYLIIDRWSRFVVSAYLSLRPPSYEEVRHALLVAFTSREARFRMLGIDIDDERWPVGRMPAVLCPDRGSDFMSESMVRAVVEDLRIEMTPLPPLCPDGKAIVERLIREIKRRMAGSRARGVYADRPLDPHSKRAAARAESAAVHTLADAYRLLIEIIDDHNNRPHRALRRRRVLTQASVAPTPRQAYLWGLQHITGLRMPPLTDEDYRRLLLASDKGSIAAGIVRYRSRPYEPVNEAARVFAARSARRATPVDLRLDRTDPQHVYVPLARREWPVFRATDGASAELAGLTLDEEDALAESTALLWARAEHTSRRERVVAKSGKTPRKKPAGAAVKLDKQGTHDARQRETDALKRRLTGQSPAPSDAPSPATASATDWARLDEEERLRNLELIRRHRSKS